MDKPPPGKVDVYHLKEFGKLEPQWPDDYEHAARVSVLGHLDEAELEWAQTRSSMFYSLEYAWRCTQTFEEPWWSRNNVDLIAPDETEGRRSTSVHDIMMRPDGSLYVVCPIGFTRIVDGRVPTMPELYQMRNATPAEEEGGCL